MTSSKSVVFELQPPRTYAASRLDPVLLTQPQHLASYSYGDNRELLLDDARKNSSLRWYREPALGVNLRYRFEKCTWRPDDLDEGLDALLEWYEPFR